MYALVESALYALVQKLKSECSYAPSARGYAWGAGLTFNASIIQHHPSCCKVYHSWGNALISSTQCQLPTGNMSSNAVSVLCWLAAQALKLATKVLPELAPLSSWEQVMAVAEGGLKDVLINWMQLLQQDLTKQQHQQSTGLHPQHHQQQQLRPHHMVWPVDRVWVALKTLIDLMSAEALLQLPPDLSGLPIVVLQTAVYHLRSLTGEADAAMAEGSAGRGGRQSAAAAAAGRGSLVHALTCLEMLLQKMGPGLWRLVQSNTGLGGPLLSPTASVSLAHGGAVHVPGPSVGVNPAAAAALVTPLELQVLVKRCCWCLLANHELMLLKGLVGVCGGLLLSRLPAWGQPGVMGGEILPLLQHMMLVVPRSEVVHKMVRGLALEV
jgi:hypothetical protein